MTHLSLAAPARDAPPHASTPPADFTALLGDRSRLRSALENKRISITMLESDWVAAAEADAAVGRGRTVRMDDRETWDRPTWDRYLAAASKYEPDYMPRIKRLLGEIDNLLKLLALPSEATARAA